MDAISTRSQRRRIGRLREDVRRLQQPPDRGPTLADYGDRVLERLGLVVVQQGWLDLVEEREWTAAIEASGEVPAVGQFRALDFERAGVRRLPVRQGLEVCRQLVERMQLHQQHLPLDQPAVAPPAPAPQPEPQPPAEPEPEPEVAEVIHDDRLRVRMLRTVDGRSGGQEFRVRAGQVVAVPEDLARRWLELAWAEEADRQAEGR